MFFITDIISSLTGNQCAFCGERIEVYESPCATCLRTLTEKSKEHFLSNHLPGYRGNFSVYSAFSYDMGLKKMILQNKRSAHPSFVNYFAEELLRKIPDGVWRNRILVPVPGSAFQEIHLVESLAECLQMKGIMTRSMLVRNPIHMGSQKKLGNNERRSIQINKQFKLLDKKTDQEVILFDDVCTTGSTLGSLKKMLENTRRAKVHCGITLAYTEKILF